MWILKIAALILYTLVLGFPALVVAILLPGGDAMFRFARVWCRWVSRTGGVTYRILGADRVDWSRHYLFVSNHTSQFDIPALVTAIPISFRMVAKRSLFYIPIFGWALYLGGFVAIDRRDRTRTFRSLDRAAEKIRRGTSLLVFAEGTRNPDDGLLPFKKGSFVLALRARADIVPVVVRGGREILPTGSMRVRPGTMEIEFGRPVPIESFSSDERDRLMARVRGDMLALLDRTDGPAGAPTGQN